MGAERVVVEVQHAVLHEEAVAHVVTATGVERAQSTASIARLKVMREVTRGKAARGECTEGSVESFFTASVSRDKAGSFHLVLKFSFQCRAAFS